MKDHVHLKRGLGSLDARGAAEQEKGEHAVWELARILINTARSGRCDGGRG